MRDSPEATTKHRKARREVLDGEAVRRHTGEKSRTGQGQPEGKEGTGRFVTAARSSGTTWLGKGGDGGLERARRSSELGEDTAALVEKVDAGGLPASDLHERGLRRAVKPRR